MWVPRGHESTILSLSVSLSLCLSVSLSLCRSVALSLCLCLCLSLYLSLSRARALPLSSVSFRWFSWNASSIVACAVQHVQFRPRGVDTRQLSMRSFFVWVHRVFGSQLRPYCKQRALQIWRHLHRSGSNCSSRITAIPKPSVQLREPRWMVHLCGRFLWQLL